MINNDDKLQLRYRELYKTANAYSFAGTLFRRFVAPLGAVVGFLLSGHVALGFFGLLTLYAMGAALTVLAANLIINLDATVCASPFLDQQQKRSLIE